MPGEEIFVIAFLFDGSDGSDMSDGSESGRYGK